MKRNILCGILILLVVVAQAVERQRLNFNADWRLCIGDVPTAAEAAFDDSGWTIAKNTL